jgi:hypothetical protein
MAPHSALPALAALLLALLSPTARGVPQAGAPWPQPFRDSDHSSCSPIVGPASSPTLAFKTSVGLQGSSAAIAADGSIYLGSANGLVALTAAGVIRWT